jgi:hypothetical protein
MPLSLFAMMDSVMTRPLTVRCDKSRPDQFKAPLKLPDAQTTRNCRLEEIADGIVVNSQTKQRFNYSDPCVELGATVAYHASSNLAQAQRQRLGHPQRRRGGRPHLRRSCGTPARGGTQL